MKVASGVKESMKQKSTISGPYVESNYSPSVLKTDALTLSYRDFYVLFLL